MEAALFWCCFGGDQQQGQLCTDFWSSGSSFTSVTWTVEQRAAGAISALPGSGRTQRLGTDRWKEGSGADEKAAGRTFPLLA
ncbi:hypothetical protein JRQ81_004542 [Phrynocephalus forsythii]|uniref:Uncharacterized protein n=1 Tax=Phrynocephalus forsythii TaxID=171643 RepID=A0A9Q1AV46_9SAUR|nr:hypothetical protein JRQ81_004542 [Phrynocephalus forsythii]